MHINQLPLFFLIPISVLSINLHAQTTISKTSDGWSLLVDGNPFEIKGATFGYNDDAANYDHYFEDLQSLGVNTIRTWGTDENTPALLDAAQKHDIKVMLGIWMRHGRPGMEADDSFNYLKDTEGKQEMHDQAIATVQKYKDHPAVLTWGIGNEVYLNTATNEEKEAYSKLLEKICSEIKALDGQHPITSVEAWTFGLDWWPKYVPSIDIYGLNCYGPGAALLADELKKRKIDKPYIVTEFGVTGEWDLEIDPNGVTPEPTDQQKYDAIVRGYPEWIKGEPSCLGVYIFHYANGKDFIAPWLYTHFDSMLRPQYWAIREAYTGQKPQNKVPKIYTFQLAENKSPRGTWVPITLTVFDTEREKLNVRFFYNQRSGSRKRRDQLLPLQHRGNLEQGFEIQMPKENGGIKVYVMVNDTYGNVGIATLSTIVEDAEAAARKYLVPKATLPFYVYKDHTSPYIPSAYMGNYEALEVDMSHAKDPHSGNACIRISYKDHKDWYGVGLVDPANDWGDILGGYDISGASTFSFWAKASDPKVKAKIGFGLIDKDKPFPDTAKETVEIVLTEKWKQYTIKTKKLDLSCIRSGLVVFVGSPGYSHEIFLDDVVFE